MEVLKNLWRAQGHDPRWYQIGALATLLAYGIGWLEFDLSPLTAVTILCSTLLTQGCCTYLKNLPSYDPKSALISGLSLCLLLRTNSFEWALAASVLTIGGKFLLRWDGRHVFNPTNFGLVVTLLTGAGWVSAGQWGAVAFFAFFIACLGSLVVTRAARGDVTGAFLGSYAALLFARAWWLGDPLAIPLHQLQSGALLLFAFFMISDPKTTPVSRRGRILFAFLVAVGAASVQFLLYRPNGLQWSLAASVLLVPLINRLFPGASYEWNRPLAHSPSIQEGGVHEGFSGCARIAPRHSAV